MKYYVVSEDELERLHGVGFSEGVLFCGKQGPDYDYQRFESEDNEDLAMGACRAREVPEWATHFQSVHGIDSIGANTTLKKEIKR